MRAPSPGHCFVNNAFNGVPLRVPASAFQEIKRAARASGRSVAEELAALAEQAIEARKRFPSSAVAQAVEVLTLSLLLAGEAYARDVGAPSGPWQDDLECRRAAALAACESLLAFVSADPDQQRMTLDVLMGRVASKAVNFPRPGQEG